MQSFLAKLKNLFKRISAFIPEQLPKTKDDFDKWFIDLTSIYNLPNTSDYKQAVATVIMHLDQLTDKQSKRHFAKSIRKSMANQIAYNIIDQIRRDDIKKREEKEKQLTEAEAVVSPETLLGEGKIQSGS